ncbi:MAG TPA: SIS domain-containing protein [Candidatus Sulfomarinibacteraceae bacterium]|nr:SIS domain-containing protein [Candidatus Sulfomarinibacteraceae bacterium]
MTDPFDPDAPLPGPPQPWASTDMPSRRDGPPFHMTDMIRVEPAMAARLLRKLTAPDRAASRLAAAVRATAAAGRPIQVVGCGTSEHGALATAEILRDACRSAGLPSALGAGGAPIAVQAFEASLELSQAGPGGLVIAISHEGSTWATNRMLESARASGATTALVTVSAASPGASLADIVVTTDELDRSWCHTVGYVSPILAAAAVGAHLAGGPLGAGGIAAATRLLAHGLDAAQSAAADEMARNLAGMDRLIVLGSGTDRMAARELALKVEEGAHLPAAMRDVETMLHGHLAGVDERTGLVLILAERSNRGARTARALGALRACREIGVRVGAILADVVAEEIDPALTPAGRIAAPDAPELAAPVAALLASATPLQLLTERLAIARGVNPDPIRRDDPRYLAAAEAAG